MTKLPSGHNPFDVLESHYLGKPPATWYPVRIDKVRNSVNGNVFQYTVSEINPSVGVVALDEQNHIMLVGQWRYTLNKYSWEIPTGAIDKNEKPANAAKRELLEETGLKAAQWAELGTIDNSNGATTDVGHLFLARDLTENPPQRDPNEIIQTAKIPFSEAIALVHDSGITESLSIAAILRADHFLKHQE